MAARPRPGLSPRMRGNRGHGSIPAHAGEPRCDGRGTQRWLDGVYPRACGGTRRRCRRVRPLAAGLSPRMRGNLARSAPPRRPGSIPAHAGEPTSMTEHPSRVYPRACGGTVAVKEDADVTTGLSPRMRGNLPHAVRTGRAPRRVYPRACGGTNPHDPRAGPIALERGSIPAHAGEPKSSHAGADPAEMGVLIGSIPAHAGEPVAGSSGVRGWGLSPRMRGNLGRSAHVAANVTGLSPRMRGNRPPAEGACKNGRVYPRACGGNR